MKPREDGIPRRADVTLNAPAEIAIRAAIYTVELLGADPLLTEAVVLLGQAKDKVSDYLDRPPKPKLAPLCARRGRRGKE